MERKEYRTDLSREKGPPAENPFIEKSGKVHSGAGLVTVSAETQPDTQTSVTGDKRKTFVFK